MEPNKNSILFSGGKLIGAERSAEKSEEGFKMTKNDKDESWTITVVAKISKEEAEKAIFKFSDLKLDAGDQKVEESNPNMPFFAGLDDSGNSVFVPLSDNSTISPFYYREDFGSITLKLNFENFGKTQNPKTQNARS